MCDSSLSGGLFRHSLTAGARWQGMKSNIAKTRREEMKKMFSFQIADHFLGGVWRVLPVASVLTTFGVFSLLGGKLTPQLTFTSLALLDVGMIDPGIGHYQAKLLFNDQYTRTMFYHLV